MSLTIACVAVNNYQGRQADYVNNLRKACQRQITIPHTFACITDDASGFASDIRIIEKPKNAWGWWCKIYLFSPGLFTGRCLFFDLDTLLLANLDDLANYDGPFACLGCARYNRMFWSGVLAWESGKYDFIWTEWMKAGYPLYGDGDDHWMDFILRSRRSAVVRVQTKFTGIYSYKHHKCEKKLPEDARLVYFTKPKPHQAADWVQRAWANGGLITPEEFKPKPSFAERLALKGQAT